MATCPICTRAPADAKYKPFCSKRCADVDLQRWFTGGYAIPVRDDEPTDDAERSPFKED
ncbi:MAG: DNA gyrase inhibitor YacG [Brevundimonas sp.]|nr:DNA gyrase inhibitor YacG [Brevundimonas sp.]